MGRVPLPRLPARRQHRPAERHGKPLARYLPEVIESLLALPGDYDLDGELLAWRDGVAGRWTPDLTMDWVPLRPERVAEVAYTILDGIRFRHPARLVRWRPDRDPRSCTVEQLRH